MLITTKFILVSTFFVVLTFQACGPAFHSDWDMKSEALNSSSRDSELQPIQGLKCTTPLDVGRVTAHLLNRAEYNNSVRDIFGITKNFEAELPEDSFADTFNNNANIQYMTPARIADYLTTAEAVVNEAFKLRKSALLSCSVANDSCAKQILEPIALKVYRRPASTAEVEDLIWLYNQGLSNGLNFEDSIKLSIRGMLSSTHFLYRTISASGSGTTKDLTNYELATRLSYFIWSSTPDAELLSLAQQGKLSDPRTLTLQVQRMIKSPKAQALVNG